MKKVLIPAAAVLLLASAGFAQSSAPANTQILVEVDSKAELIPALTDVRLKVNGKEQPLAAWSQVPASGAQIAILIDDGLREAIGRELSTLKSFVANLPPGTQIYIGYMQSGSVLTVQPFTDDHAAASQRFRLPEGSPGISASPYFCLSEFVKHWPVDPSRPGARFVLMITNGVDPYNGSTSVLNQDSPYVQTATTDAQRAGVSVSSIYFGDAGIHGGRANFSGQSYLAQISEGTGGRAYYEGSGNPVSLSPYLAQFQHATAETFVASFAANPSGKKLVDIRVDTKLHGAKLHGPAQALPGNMESTPQN